MTLSTFVPAPSLFSPWIANMHALRPTPPLHQLDSSHIPESYHKQRILNYINNINPAHWPEIDITTPSSSPSFPLTNMGRSMTSTVATKTRNLTYADGVAYGQALLRRNISLEQEIPPSYAERKPDYELPSTLTAPTEVKYSLEHANLNRNRAVGLAAFSLSMPFFVTEWLIHMSELNYHVSMHFKTEPLETGQTVLRPLSIPDPDIIIGYKWNSIRGNYRLAFNILPDSLKFAFPIAGDANFALPFFSIEMRIDTEQGPRRNLHMAALMLRALRNLYQKACGKNDEADKFDGKVRVLTATINRIEVNVFGHWTSSRPGDPNVTYEHFLIKRWRLQEMEELYAARHGLETLCKWMMNENRKWIVSGLQELAKT